MRTRTMPIDAMNWSRLIGEWPPEWAANGSIRSTERRRSSIAGGGRGRPLIGRIIMTLVVGLAGVMITASPSAAVSSWSGKDPYHDYDGQGACATWTNNNHVQRLDETWVYDGSTFLGWGYLGWSPRCQTNWSEFWWHDGAVWGNHTVEPWAWEQGKTGTDQSSPDLGATDVVYSRMVDGRGPACAGAHVYRYPSHQWITWFTFGCE